MFGALGSKLGPLMMMGLGAYVIKLAFDEGEIPGWGLLTILIGYVLVVCLIAAMWVVGDTVNERLGGQSEILDSKESRVLPASGNAVTTQPKQPRS